MKKKDLKALITTAISILLCLSVIGCGGGAGTGGGTTTQAAATTAAETSKAPETTKAETTTAKTEAETQATSSVVTLQMFSMPANTSGLMEATYWTDILERDLGVRIELMPSGDQGEQKLAALMAANDFPDVVVLKSYKQVTDAIAAGLLVCLDDHQAELPDAFENIPNAIQYYRDNVSNGTGKCYALANDVSNTGASTGDTDYGPHTRWDLYKQLGMPVLNTFEDYLPLLKQMQELYPTNEDGQKVYGISLWTDWDSTSMQSAGDFLAYYGVGQLEFVEVNYKTGAFKTIFDDDSLYKRWLKFLFDANQMGILDPDSLSQRWNDYLDKQSAGRILFTYWNWGYSDYNTPARTEQVKGFQPVYVNDTTIERGTGPSFIGGTWPYGVGTGTKHMDEAFKLINYYYSLDGIWTMQYGDKGVYWDLDENGKPYKTEFGWKIDDDPSLEMPNGDRPGKGISVINSCGVNLGRATHPVYGTGDSNAWVKKDFAPPDNNLVKDWKETTNIKEGSIKYLKSKGMLFEKPFAPMEPYNDEINQINLRIGDMCKTQSWLIAFAKDEAEFESLWADMAEQAKGMNLDATVKETQEMYNNAKEFGSKYAK